MKKWSIGLLAASALAVVAMAFPVVSSAAPGPYCPEGTTGTYPYCQPSGGGAPPTPPPQTCAAGEVGTYPNCVKPALGVAGIRLKPNTTTLVFRVNAPGTVKVSGKGIKQKRRKVKPGNVRIKIQLTPKKKRQLKRKGKVFVRVKVTYTPTGGSPIRKTLKVKVKAPRRKKR